jgi:hypothetical protein
MIFMTRRDLFENVRSSVRSLTSERKWISRAGGGSLMTSQGRKIVNFDPWDFKNFENEIEK